MLKKIDRNQLIENIKIIGEICDEEIAKKTVAFVEMLPQNYTLPELSIRTSPKDIALTWYIRGRRGYLTLLMNQSRYVFKKVDEGGRFEAGEVGDFIFEKEISQIILDKIKELLHYNEPDY